ncbi:acetyltransferase [bacterium]|nr:acetyltransferase [bacterium]NUN45529.1 acetyltransferase [bacterium]
MTDHQRKYVTLRKATSADSIILRFWDEQPHVIESDPNDDWHWEEELQREPSWREQLIAELDGKPIGFIQIIDPQREETQYWGAIGSGYRALDIWIGEAENLSKGYGTAMMHQAIERCFTEEDVHTVIIDPLADNVRAHRFYERLGFRFVREQRFGEDDCFVYELKREDWMKR